MRAPGQDYESFDAFVARGLAPSVSVEARALSGSHAARIFRFRADAPLPDPAVAELLLHLLTAGDLRYATDFGFGRFEGVKRPGEFDLAPPGTQGQFEGEGPFELLSLSMPWTAVSQIADRAGIAPIADLGGLHARMSECASISQLVGQLWREGGVQNPFAAQFADAALSAVVLRLLRLADAPMRKVPAAIARGGLAPWQVRRVKEWIEADLAGEHTVETLAALVSLSPFHFVRAFAASIGKPPHTYLVERRMIEARRLLRETDTDMTEIGLSVGYSGGGAFARAFRQHTGMSPSAYRRLR
jgi:AraC family transcriptional regulator